MAADTGALLKLRITGDGSYNGTVVEVVDEAGEKVGQLALVKELHLHLGPGAFDLARVDMVVCDAEVRMEMDVELTTLGEPRPVDFGVDEPEEEQEVRDVR
jgi:hypothetical protein